MCGIFCAVSFGEPYTHREYNVFKTATDLVSHRGPDAFGYKKYRSSENYPAETFNIFFGHRRLSIIDLSTSANQPMEDNGIVIIYNGEIFNYIELKQELILKGIHFRTNSDTEVILKIYETEGSKGFAKLNGMWAFIIYDSTKKLIIASRDRFSIKPLFYLQEGANLYFASEIKQLLPLLKTKNLNTSAVFNFLQQGIADFDDQTFYRSIQKVKAKVNLIVELKTGQQREEIYWDYNTEHIENEITAANIFREILYDSIKLRLRSEVQLGALLSGGLDSSAISIIANKLNSKSFMTFSIVSDDEEFSEEIFIDELVRSAKIPNHKIPFNSDDVLGKLNEVIYYQDEPFGSFSIIAQNLIFEKIKQYTDITVVLSGQGGDEIMMGYLKFFFFYLKNLTRRRRFDLVFKELITSLINRTVISQFNLGSAKRYIQYFQQSKADFIIYNGVIEKIWEAENLKERQRLDIDKYSIPILARYEDRNSMAYSLETRVPFLDHRLVNFLLNVREDLKLKNGWTKYILRKSLPELPAKIRWRRDKRNFLIPEDKWLKADLIDDVKKSFTESTLAKFGVIDDRKFLDYYNLYLNGNKFIHHADISRLYITEKWLQTNFK